MSEQNKIYEIERLKNEVMYWKLAAENQQQNNFKLLAEIERKDEALRFYADEKNHQNVRLYAGFDSIVKQDGGQRAREAL